MRLGRRSFATVFGRRFALIWDIRTSRSRNRTRDPLSCCYYPPNEFDPEASSASMSLISEWTLRE